MTLEPVPSPSPSPTPYALSSWRLVHLELPADLAGHLVNGVSSDGRLVLVQEPQAAQSVHLIVSATDVRDLIVPGHTQGAPIGSVLSPDGHFVLLSELGQAWQYDIASMVYSALPNPPGTTGGQFSVVDAQHLLVLTGPLASYEFGGTTNTQLWRLDLNTLTYTKLGMRHDGIAANPTAEGGAVLLVDTSPHHDNTGWIFYRILPDGSDHVLYDYRAHYPGPLNFAVARDGQSLAFTNTAGRASLYEGSSGAGREVGAGIVRDFSPDSVLLRLEQKDGTVEAVDRSGTIVYSVPGPASGWIRVP